MQHYVKVIVEHSISKWYAWFEASPEVAFDGDMPIDCVRRLLAHVGEDQFEQKLVIASVDSPKSGHWEFLVALQNSGRFPAPSLN